MDFKVGDIVRLRSGGPMMVLVSLGKRDDGQEVALCSWATSADEYREASIPLAALTNR